MVAKLPTGKHSNNSNSNNNDNNNNNNNNDNINNSNNNHNNNNEDHHNTKIIVTDALRTKAESFCKSIAEKESIKNYMNKCMKTYSGVAEQIKHPRWSVLQNSQNASSSIFYQSQLFLLTPRI